MSSNNTGKRRRSINIHESLIDALKAEAARRGAKTHTGLASDIALGESEPLPFGVKLEGKRRGISMKESTWLSIKSRSDKLSEGKEKPISHALIFMEMLIGTQEHLSKEEISLGLTQASEREKDRVVKCAEVEPNGITKDAGEKNIQPDPDTQSDAQQEPEGDSKFSFSPKPEKRSEPKEFEIEEFYGGVKMF